MKTTRPLELIYFSLFPMQTKDEGIVYTYFALDDYSEFLILIGTDTVSDEETILKNILLFTKNEDFIKGFKNKPFTLMLPFEKDTIPHDLVADILKPLNGSVAYNQEKVFKKVKPVLNAVFGT